MRSGIILMILLVSAVLIPAGVCGAEPIPVPATGEPPVPVGEGYFEFRCNIEGAGVSLDGTSLGAITNGSLLVRVPVYTQPFRRQLLMEAPGYSSYTETILTSPKAGETLIIRGNLKILPFNQTGTLSLAVSPPGGEVRIDGTPSGVIPYSGILALRTVKAGNRNLQVSLPGYEEYTEMVRVEANMETKKRIILVPQTTGTLEITSEPSGAAVTINDTPYGVTPLTVTGLNQGTYIVGYSLPGYQPFLNQVILVPGQSVIVPAAMQPVPTPTPTPATPVPTPEPTRAGIPAGVIITGCAIALASWQKKE